MKNIKFFRFQDEIILECENSLRNSHIREFSFHGWWKTTALAISCYRNVPFCSSVRPISRENYVPFFFSFLPFFALFFDFLMTIFSRYIFIEGSRLTFFWFSCISSTFFKWKYNFYDCWRRFFALTQNLTIFFTSFNLLNIYKIKWFFMSNQTLVAWSRLGLSMKLFLNFISIW